MTATPAAIDAPTQSSQGSAIVSTAIPTSATSPGSDQTFAVDEGKVNDVLTASLKILWRNPRLNERAKFRICPDKNKDDVDHSMEQLKLGHHARDIKNLVRMVDLAKDMFEFFLPADFVAPVTLKYWGGLYACLQKWVRGLQIFSFEVHLY
jgi:hypothetical protein